MSDSKYVEVFCGDYCTLVVDDKGVLFVCGSNEGGKLGVKKKRIVSGLQRFEGGVSNAGVRQVVAKRDVLAVLTVEGDVYFCGLGDNNTHRLDLPIGHGRAQALGINSRGLYVVVGDAIVRFRPSGSDLIMREKYLFPSSVSVLDVCCTSSAVFARSRDGQVYVVGGGVFGELGLVIRQGDRDAAAERVSELTRVAIKNGSRVSKLACGKRHVLALLDDGSGELYAWGSNDCGQLGLGRDLMSQPTPARVPGFGKRGYIAVEIGCGVKHSVAVLDSKDVLGWGSSKIGRLGLKESGRNIYQPTFILKPDGDGDVVDDVRVFCGRRHTVVLWNGALYVVGDNRLGQLGLPLETSEFMRV